MPFSSPSFLRLPLFFLAFSFLLFLSPRADAFSFQGQLYAGLGAANINQAAPTVAGWWGPSLHTGLVLNLGDFFRATADFQGSYHLQRSFDDQIAGPHQVYALALGARYVFDVLSYVPYVGLSLVTYPLGVPDSAQSPNERFGLRATIGMDYRHSRRWSFGGAVELSAPLLEPANLPLYSSARAHIAFHFRRF